MRDKFKDKFNFIQQNKGIIVATISLLLLFFYNFTKLKMVNFDHLAFNNLDFVGTMKRTYQYLIMEQARPNFVLVLTTALEYLLVDHYWIWTILFIFVASFLVGAILKAITENGLISFLGFIISICLSTISLEPISMPSSYAFIMGFGIWMALGSVFFTIQYNKLHKYSYKIVATILIILCMFSYEVGILYIPVLIGINCLYLKSLDIKKNVRASKEFLLAGAIYVIAYVIVGSVYVASYEGTKINDSFKIITIIYTWIFMLIANIPGFFFFYNKSNAYQSPLDFIKNYGDNSFGLLDIAENYITLSLIIQVILFGYLLYKVVDHAKKLPLQNNMFSKPVKRKLKNNKENSIIWGVLPVLVGIYTVVIPMLPSALTKYTQDQVKARWRLIGICNQYSYFFLIIGVSLLAYYLIPILRRKRVLSICLCLILVLQFGLVSFTNIRNSEFINLAGNRFEQFDTIIEDIAERVGNDGVVFAPSLFEAASPLSVPWFYFTARFKYTTNTSVNVVYDLTNIQNSNNIFYLRYLYSTDNNNALFILSKVTLDNLSNYKNQMTLSDNATIISDSATVYCFSNQKEFNLIGRVNNTNEGEIISVIRDNMKTVINTFDIFLYGVNHNSKLVSDPITIDFIGNSINLNSLAILPCYSSIPYNREKINISSNKVGTTLSTCDVINGYYADGWIGESAEFRIQTGKVGKIILTGSYLNNITGNETGVIFIDDKKYPYKITEPNFVIELSAKAESIVTIRIENDFSHIFPPDIRQLSFILSNLRGQ